LNHEIRDLNEFNVVIGLPVMKIRGDFLGDAMRRELQMEVVGVHVAIYTYVCGCFCVSIVVYVSIL